MSTPVVPDGRRKLNGRVTHDEIPANLIARNAGRQEDSVCIPHDNVVDDHVVVDVGTPMPKPKFWFPT